MKAWKEITYYAGFDWANDHHDVVIVDRRGQIVADFHRAHGGGLAALAREVAALGPEFGGVRGDQPGRGRRATARKRGHGLSDLPGERQRLPGRKVPSGNKTDRLDAWSLADALRLDGHGWKALAKEDPADCRVAAALPR